MAGADRHGGFPAGVPGNKSFRTNSYETAAAGPSFRRTTENWRRTCIDSAQKAGDYPVHGHPDGPLEPVAQGSCLARSHTDSEPRVAWTRCFLRHRSVFGSEPGLRVAGVDPVKSASGKLVGIAGDTILAVLITLVLWKLRAWPLGMKAMLACVLALAASPVSAFVDWCISSYYWWPKPVPIDPTYIAQVIIFSTSAPAGRGPI